MRDWYRVDASARHITLTVHVQPNARATAVAGPHGDALKVRIAASAVDSKANQALLAFLQSVLGLRAPQISIRSGARGRRKLIVITGADAALLARLDSLSAR